jgi:hypothetical protein
MRVESARKVQRDEKQPGPRRIRVDPRRPRSLRSWLEEPDAGIHVRIRGSLRPSPSLPITARCDLHRSARAPPLAPLPAPITSLTSVRTPQRPGNRSVRRSRLGRSTSCHQLEVLPRPDQRRPVREHPHKTTGEPGAPPLSIIRRRQASQLTPPKKPPSRHLTCLPNPKPRPSTGALTKEARSRSTRAPSCDPRAGRARPPPPRAPFRSPSHA